MENKFGKIVQVIGAVVDVHFSTKSVLPEIRFGQKTDAKDCDAYPRGSYFPKTTAKPDADTDTDSKGR